MTDIQENILLYSETVINTVCRSIQVSEQKYVDMSLLPKIEMVSEYEIVGIS
jgi:hypothetical protein